MREILFRGKSNCSYGKVKKGDWLYSMTISRHCYDDKEITSYYIGSGINTIDGKTLGQYTGLTDKNGKKIFEGDVVKNDWCFMCGNSVIKFGQYKTLDMGNEYQQGHLGFYLEHIHEADKRSVRKDIMYFANNCEIVGNIYDNPELLKGGE